jgi:integrase
MNRQHVKLNPLLFPKQLRSHSLTNHLQDDSPADRLPVSVRLCLSVIDRLTGLNKVIALAMLSTGSRVVEILNLRIHDISQTGHVVIRATKLSQSRVVFYPALVPFAHPKKFHHSHLIFGFHSYFKFYRAVRPLLPGDSPRSRQRLKVSNLFRCAAADLAAYLSNGDRSIPSVFLGHKSPRSTSYYLKLKETING